MSRPETVRIPLLDVAHAPLPAESEPLAEVTTHYAPDQAGPGKRISLHFSLSMEEGELVDSCFDSKPATFDVGDGSLLPGFEKQLFGLHAGDECTCQLPPEQAFGLRHQGNIQRFARYRFPADLVIQEGMMIDFSDGKGYNQAGVVAAQDSIHVTMDFNHPLAGRTILFRARIVSVEQADARVAESGGEQA